MVKFEFATASRIIFGAGAVSQVAPLAAEMGRRALGVASGSAGRAPALWEELRPRGIETVPFLVRGEPTIDLVKEATRRAREAACDMVVAIGGGSVLDTGKAVAALLTNEGDLMDYLEVIGRGLPIRRPPAPCIAIPTTAGTGAEVTRNAVIGSPEHHVKVSMRSPLMLPRLAVVDPELTYSVPPDVTASTGLDALTQLLEAFVSLKANPMTDGLCREGIPRAARSLRRAYENGRDAAAREDMALASLFGGLTLANAGLGAVHGFAAPLGGMLATPHGVICARLLPFVMEANVRALRRRAPDSPALGHYAEVAQLLTGNPAARAEDGVAWTRDLCAAVKVPPLSALGLREADYAEAAAKAAKASSIKGNPIPLENEELIEILKNAE